MKNFWQSFLLLLSGSSESELAQQIQYLKVENDILRNKLPHRIRVTAKERQRLLRFGKPLGKAIWQLVSIVSPRTFLRWTNAPNSNTKPDGQKLGRPAPMKNSAT